MNSSTAPVYQSECSPAKIRGILLTLQGTTTILGLCVGEFVCYKCSRKAHTNEEKPIGLTMAPASPNRRSNGNSPWPSKPSSLYS